MILILQFPKRVKEYIQEEAAICPQPNADKFVIQFPGQLNFTTGISSVEFHGNFTITDVIQEPLEVCSSNKINGITVQFLPAVGHPHNTMYAR